jgi:DNA-directed RNA polymerase
MNIPIPEYQHHFINRFPLFKSSKKKDLERKRTNETFRRSKKNIPEMKNKNKIKIEQNQRKRNKNCSKRLCAHRDPKQINGWEI